MGQLGLLSIHFPGLENIERFGLLVVLKLVVRFGRVWLHMNPDVEVAAEAFRCGASGYLLKSCMAAEIVLAIREVLRGKSYMSATLSRDTVNFLRR